MLRFSRNLILLALLTMGIGILGSFERVEADSNPRPIINSPVEIFYLLENPIEISRIDRGEGRNQDWNYIQISGLRDTSVEKSINEKIESLFNQMLPYAKGERLPPYRGIVRVVEGRELSFCSIYFQPSFNYNNILSIIVNVSGAYGPHYFSLMEPLNIDLTTGETFSIEDVFTDDVDGLAIVNTAIVEEIARRRLFADNGYGYSHLRLVAPFQGISEEQKFFLNIDGLAVVIDYNDPAFDVGFVHSVVEIPLPSTDGNIAITQRFMDRDDPIFTSSTREKLLLRKSLMYAAVHEHFSYNLEGISWHVSMNYPDYLSPTLIESIHELQGELEERAILHSKEEPISNVENHFEVFSIGPCVNVLVFINYYGPESFHWNEVSYVFKETGERMELGDLFVEGYGYNQLIKDYFVRAIKESGLSYLDYSDSIDSLLEGSYFKLQGKDLVVITRPLQWDSEEIYQVYFAIPYNEIGYENLILFQ